MSHNPFASIGAIRNLSYFYGRQKELRQIFDFLHNQTPQSIQIVGDGKTGKTSLLNYLTDPETRKANALDSQYQIFVYFSFQSNPLIGQQEFWKNILKKISRQIGDDLVKQHVERYVNLEALSFDHIEELFHFLMDREYQLFLLIDEFQVLAENPDLLNKVFLSNLRFLSSRYNVRYVVATEIELTKLIPEIYGSPFPNAFAIIFLNVFTEQEARDFILQVKQPLPLSLEAEQEFILQLAGRHPFLTQTVCYWTFDVKSQKRVLAEEDVDFVLEESLDRARSYFQGNIWPKMSERMQKVLLDIAWGREIDAIAYRDVLRNLVREKHYITKQEENKWSIFCELFRSFLREQGPRREGTSRAPLPDRPSHHLDYDDFEIDIGPEYPGMGYLVHVIHSEAGEGRGYSRFDLKTLQESLDEIRKRETDLLFIKKFGADLMGMLMVDEVRRRFDTAIGRIAEGERGLRVRLRTESPELAHIPWEFLYEEEGGRWLATSTSVTLSRYVEIGPQPLTKIKLPLNILMVLSNPSDSKEYGLPELDIKKERDQIVKELKNLIDLGLVTVTTLSMPTVSDVRRRLGPTGKQYHVLHFCGHGLFTDEEVDNFNYPVPLDKNMGYLIFQDKQHHSQPVHQETLIELVKDKGVQLVVINACRTAASAPSQRLSGLATALVHNTGIPAVVAMQYEVLDEIAPLFAQEFYAALARNLPVDVCIAEARRAIAIDYDHANRDWATPVLYMRSKDGKIFDLLTD